MFHEEFAQRIADRLEARALACWKKGERSGEGVAAPRIYATRRRWRQKRLLR